MKNLTHLMSEHHDRCDAAFCAADNAAVARDWPACRAATREFVYLLESHFRAEEELLFPDFEARSGLRRGPTAVMREEHSQIRSLVADLRQAATQADGAAFDAAAATLLILMEQHNLKEEGILYPLCDQLLPNSAAGLARLLGVPAEVAHA
jgi:iron-sulfur cluster repair protein YtfE (RIC family)